MYENSFNELPYRQSNFAKCSSNGCISLSTMTLAIIYSFLWLGWIFQKSSHIMSENSNSNCPVVQEKFTEKSEVSNYFIFNHFPLNYWAFCVENLKKKLTRPINGCWKIYYIQFSRWGDIKKIFGVTWLWKEWYIRLS